MTINTSISPSLRNPQTFHRFFYQLGSASLTPLPRRMAMIGTQKGGTATASQIYAINDPGETDALFGDGSPLALMCRKAFETGSRLGGQPFLFAVGVVEPAAGAQRVQTLTVTGTATAADNLVVSIAGRSITIGVSVGDTAATVAAALNAAINAAKKLLPVTSGVAAGVVTTTAVAKGVNGLDIAFSVDKVPAGLTVVSAQSVAGSGVADPTAALAAVAGPDFDAIALENHAAADIALALTHVTSAWLPAEKRWRWILLGETGSIGTATALASAANDRAIVDRKSVV